MALFCPVAPEFQSLEVGQWVPMAPQPSDTTAFKVAGFEVNRWLLWQQPLSTWAWVLTPQPGGPDPVGDTIENPRRLALPGDIGFSVVLNEFGEFPMMRRMLLGIRDRAELAAA